MRKTSTIILLALMAIFITAFGLAEEGTADRTISFEESDYVIYVGRQQKLNAMVETVLETAPKQTQLIWTSSDQDVAAVNVGGMVNGKKTGKATITATAKDNESISASVEVEVRVPVQSVQINEKNVSVVVGGKEEAAKTQLTALIKPEDAFFQTGVWSSSNESVATVDSDGVVTGISAGNASITFTSDDPNGQKKTQTNVKVNQLVTSISSSEEMIDIAVGKSQKVNPIVEPEKAQNKKLDWRSSDERIATVSSNGQVKGVSPGKTEITAMATDESGVYLILPVNVYSPNANRQEGDYLFSVNKDESIKIVQYVGANIGKIVIPDKIVGRKVTIIGEKSFKKCTASSIEIPETVNHIETEAFYYAETKEIHLPDVNIKIDAAAFMCSNIVEITIPAGAEFVGSNPFRGCRNLRSITVDPDNEFYEMYQGALIEKKTMRLITIPLASIGSSLNIPEGIKAIGDTAFGYEGPEIIKLAIPDSVESIGDSAFAFSSAREISIGSGVKKMGYGSFNYCKSLETVKIADGSIVIGNSAFYNCEKLRKVYIPASVKKIAKNAFSGANRVILIVEPNSEAAKFATKYGYNWTVTDE